MGVSNASRWRWAFLSACTVTMATLGVGFLVQAHANMAVQQTVLGSIAGTVTADRGQVRAFRVKARDTVNRISYTVYTRKGHYEIFNLAPSSYEVSVMEEGFDSPVGGTELKPGGRQIVDVALRARGQQEPVESSEFDALYPPEPIRDVMRQNCFLCHWGGAYIDRGFHDRQAKTRSQWSAGVSSMFVSRGGSAPWVSSARVPTKEKESIIDYLTANFGPRYKRRRLKLDQLVRDEDALTNAIYIQYELKRDMGPPFASGAKPQPTGHSIAASPTAPGVVWVSGMNGSFLRVDTRDLNYTTRTKEWLIPYPGNRGGTSPHGIRESRGRVYTAEMGGHRISELDPKTGEVRSYPTPQAKGAPHDVWPDSKGNIWYTYHSATGMVGRLDQNKEFKEWEVLPGFAGYGVIVDKVDRVWAPATNFPAVFMYNPQTEKWTSYPMSNPGRRPTMDSKGKIWVCQYAGGKVATIDPDTGKVTEYTMPLKHGTPYDVFADADDNLWLEDSQYYSLVRFDQKTKEFTYFPMPEFEGHAYKLDTDPEGTVWFALDWTWHLKKIGTPMTLVAFKPHGNAAMRTSSAQ